MKIYLDYLEGIHEPIESPEWMKEDMEGFIKLAREEIYPSLLKDTVIKLVDGKYQALPLYPRNENFKSIPSIPLYDLMMTIYVDQYNGKEYLSGVFSVSRFKDKDDGIFINGSVHSSSLDNLFDDLRIKIYDSGINEYNSYMNITILIYSPEETKTFSHDLFYPLDKDEISRYEVSAISERIKDICSVQFNCTNILVDVTNLKYTINYVPSIKVDAVDKYGQQGGTGDSPIDQE